MSCANCGVHDKSSDGKPSGCKSNGGCDSGGCNKLNAYDWLSDVILPVDQRFHIIEISFKNGRRKGYYSNPKQLYVEKGEMLVLESSHGNDIGEVSLTGELVRIQMKKKGLKEDHKDIRAIVRKARQEDIMKLRDAYEMEPSIMLQARSIARSMKLKMKISDVELQADKKKATFFYIADGRVDFRELIKVYAREFKVKVEMRQIGARQEAGMVGGIGSCGRELCCSTWLTQFKSVSTSAARYQHLAINQAKLSGQCGRLKCCLNFELDQYTEAIADFPKNADFIKTSAGKAKLIKTDIFKRLMWYVYADKPGTSSYPITVDRVKEILKMNKENEMPENLMGVQIEIEDLEKEPESEDLVGQISLNSLAKLTKRGKRKKSNYKKSSKGPTNKSSSSKKPYSKSKSSNKNQPTAKNGPKPTDKPTNKGNSGSKTSSTNKKKSSGYWKNRKKKSGDSNNSNKPDNNNDKQG